MLDVSKLAGIIPDKVLNCLTPEFLASAGIDGKLRLSNFLGQCDEETGKFAVEIENLNYNGISLMRVFHSHFKDVNEAISYEHKPEKIANRVYANRDGNGDEASGDGWKFRGRGDLQVTFRANYKSFQDWLATKGMVVDLLNNPDLVATAPYDLLSAAWFFSEKGLWKICDRGVDIATVTTVTEKVNGGVNNLQERYAYTQQIFNALNKS